MTKHELIYTIFSLVIGGYADAEGCNGEDHGIACCYKGFSSGDNDNEGIERFIPANQYNIGCFESCKKLHPQSDGITVSVNEKYQSGNGMGRNKCWCEYGTPELNPRNKHYKTCVFTVPTAHALVVHGPGQYVLNDVSECVYAGGSFFGLEGGRIKAFPRMNVGSAINITLSIKPGNLTGMLVGVRGPKDYCILELVGGRVVFRVDNGKGEVITSHKPNVALDDGNFHQINALKFDNVVTLQVDKAFSTATGRAGFKLTDTDNPLFIGSHSQPDLIPNYPGKFQGCVKDVFINNKIDRTVKNQLDNTANNELVITSDMVYGDVTI